MDIGEGIAAAILFLCITAIILLTLGEPDILDGFIMQSNNKCNPVYCCGKE